MIYFYHEYMYYQMLYLCQSNTNYVKNLLYNCDNIFLYVENKGDINRNIKIIWFRN